MGEHSGKKGREEPRREGERESGLSGRTRLGLGLELIQVNSIVVLDAVDTVESKSQNG